MNRNPPSSRDPLLDFNDSGMKSNPKHTHICANCGATCRPKKITKGSLGWEIILWLLFLVPGIFYSVWRLTTQYWACPHCRAPDPVPLNTPRGRKLLADYTA